MDDMMLRAMMRRRGFTQERLATEIGLDRSTFNRKLNNATRGFSIKEIFAIGKALRLTRAEMSSVFLCGYQP